MAIPVESFFLDPEGEGTLHQRVQRLVAEGILSGRFQPGEKLPSSRKLARHLGVSRITVTNAYTELVADEYLISRGRSGYFVSRSAPTPPAFDLPRRWAAPGSTGRAPSGGASAPRRTRCARRIGRTIPTLHLRPGRPNAVFAPDMAAMRACRRLGSAISRC